MTKSFFRNELLIFRINLKIHFEKMTSQKIVKIASKLTNSIKLTKSANQQNFQIQLPNSTKSSLRNVANKFATCQVSAHQKISLSSVALHDLLFITTIVLQMR